MECDRAAPECLTDGGRTRRTPHTALPEQIHGRIMGRTGGGHSRGVSYSWQRCGVYPAGPYAVHARKGQSDGAGGGFSGLLIPSEPLLSPSQGKPGQRIFSAQQLSTAPTREGRVEEGRVRGMGEISCYVNSASTSRLSSSERRGKDEFYSE